jgi:hypothetical protein
MRSSKKYFFWYYFLTISKECLHLVSFKIAVLEFEIACFFSNHREDLCYDVNKPINLKKVRLYSMRVSNNTYNADQF